MTIKFFGQGLCPPPPLQGTLHTAGIIDVNTTNNISQFTSQRSVSLEMCSQSVSVCCDRKGSAMRS